MYFARYDPSTERIEVQNMPPSQFDEDCVFLELPGDIHPNYLYFHNGEIHILPPKPDQGNYWEFDRNIGEWVDPRTESDWTTELYARRAEASMPRADFIIRCVDFGVLDQQEGLQAASGTITPTMQSIIDGLPLEEQFQASVIWAASSTITRNNTLIINMAAAIFIDEWTLDEVFGVEWPDPLPSWPEGQLHP